MPTRPRQPNAGRSSHQRGYGQTHRTATALAIHREPWCHTLNGCPHPDAGTPANPLTGGHPHTLAQLAYDTEAWTAQQLQAQCARCNSARLPLTG